MFVFCASAQAEDTEQLIQQGQQAFKAGQIEQAGLIFERILLEQPALLGVWLDYALCLQQMGDNDSARAIYQSLLQQSPPEHLVPWLKQQMQITAPIIAGWQYAGAITVQSGHDSNLNRAPTASSLTLTLSSGGLLALPLSDTSRANAGASRQLRFDWQAERQGAANDDWLLQATLNTRLAPSINGQDYLQSSFAMSHAWVSASAREYHTVLAVQNLRYGGIDIQRALRAGVYRGEHWQTSAQAGCATGYGAEWEMLSYPSVTELDGQYFGIATDLGCKHKLDWKLLLRAGLDKAERSRSGGDQQRLDLLGQLGGSLGAGKWLAMAELTQLQDADGYSPLLDNNAIRNIQRGLLKLEYQYPLGSRLQALLSAEVFQQHSNLTLFSMSGRGGWLGMRYLY